MKITPENISSVGTNGVFVFGSNLRGFHAGGAAFTAIKFGAIPTIGEGLQGQTYALPTKDYDMRTRALEDIYGSVIKLLQCVHQNPHKLFMITKVGCGLAGLSVEQVAPMFRQFMELDNVSLPQEFIDLLEGNEPEGDDTVVYIPYLDQDFTTDDDTDDVNTDDDSDNDDDFFGDDGSFGGDGATGEW